MQPWQANSGPDEDTLRELVRSGLSSREIAERYGVRRQTVDYWKGRIGLVKKSTHLSHKAYLPWEVKAADANDFIARALRGYSTLQQGHPVTPAVQAQVDKLLKYLEEENGVVVYDRETGFGFVKRDKKLDKPGAVIRYPWPVD